MFDNDTAESLFPFVLVTLVVPIGAGREPRTRRFGIYFWIGMVAHGPRRGRRRPRLVLWYLVDAPELMPWPERDVDRAQSTPPLVFDEPRGAGSRRATSPTSPGRAAGAAKEAGLPAFRAKQLSTHYFARLVDDPAQMTDLPAAQRDELVAALLPDLMTPLRTLEADRGTTRKTLWKLFDGALVESVLMRYPDRATMCVSSQAGCGMACPFCATGQGGLQRNMSTAEIVEQVVAGARSLARGEVPGGPGRVSNVVFMGMGEPLANYKAVIGAVRRLTDPAPDGPRHVRARHHRLDRRAWCRGSGSSPTRASRSRWR